MINFSEPGPREAVGFLMSPPCVSFDDGVVRESCDSCMSCGERECVNNNNNNN